MPMHDWTRVEAGIYHAFHHEWISEISRALNRGLLPDGFYALPEQHAAGFGPDVLTLEGRRSDAGAGSVATKAKPKPTTTYRAEAPAEFYRRKKSAIAVRHASGDRVVAMIEIVSPGNKSSESAFKAFVRKANELLDRGVHLLLIDPFPPGKRDPEGIHAAIWLTVGGEPFSMPPERPLALVAYECGMGIEAYLEPLAVGEPLPDMPLFLAPDDYVMVPLEATYQAAWETVPARWRNVVAPPGP